MTEDQADALVNTLALSAQRVLTNALKDKGRWKRGPQFHVSAADEVELREYLVAWANQRRVTE